MKQISVSKDKGEAMVAEFNKLSPAEKQSFRDFIHKKMAANSGFKSWMFDFEQGEGFDNGLTLEHHDAFDYWIDNYDNY